MSDKPIEVEPPLIDPINLYDVAVVTDRVLKIKRVLEDAGFDVKVNTVVDVKISMEINGPRETDQGKGKR